MKIRIEVITPALATAILATNKNNRPVNKRHVGRYAADMKAGKWSVNGEAIKLDQDGQLVDGQHRLMACAISGESFTTAVVYGVDRDAQMTMDQGNRRRAGDQFKLKGVRNAGKVAAICRTLWNWERGAPLGQPWKRTPSIGELADTLTRWPTVVDGAALGCMIYAATRFGVSASEFGTWATIALEIDPKAATAFADCIATGAGLNHGHPALTLRNQFVSFAGSGRTLHRWNKLAWLVRGFDDFIDGRTRKMYRRGFATHAIRGLEGRRLMNPEPVEAQ